MGALNSCTHKITLNTILMEKKYGEIKVHTGRTEKKVQN